ncbi:MAG TPA: C45 family peptidase [Blastocatellia bacterium]|nr:C45 family peptidase [Blastocatellia bacterium]
MKRNVFLALVVCLVVVVCFSSCHQSASNGEVNVMVTPDKKLDGARRFERDGWVYVHIEGAPDKIGYQHGSLLSKEIEDLLRVMKPFLERQSKRDWNFYRESAEKMLWPKMDKEYQDEIDGIVAGATAKGVKLDRYDVVAMNAFIELAQYYAPWMEKQKGLQASTKAPGNCSAFVATGSWTKDGRVVMGHNAWTDYVIGSRWNIIFDIKPEKGHRMLMDGLPGVIASMDDFGVNENGIMITETTITGFAGFDPKGKPEFERARKAMQYSGSIDDYMRIMLEGNNGGYANDWLIGDNKTGEIALFELGLKEHSVRRTKDGYFVGSNFPVDEKLMKAETNFDPNNKASSPNARRARWEQLMAEYKGRIDVEAAKKFETESFDAFAKKQGANDRTLCGAVESSPRGVPEWDWPAFFPGGTVQAKVMDARMAEKMQILGSYGHACAPDFIAEDFLKQRKEYEWMRGLLRDMKTGDWAMFEITR